MKRLSLSPNKQEEWNTNELENDTKKERVQLVNIGMKLLIAATHHSSGANTIIGTVSTLEENRMILWRVTHYTPLMTHLRIVAMALRSKEASSRPT